MKGKRSKKAGRALALAVALHFALPACAAYADESAGGVHIFKPKPLT